MHSQFIEELKDFNPKFSEPLAPYTTWKIGGPAQVLVQVENKDQLHELLEIALKNQVKYTILGQGSNVLISDKGISGLVIINTSKNAQVLDDSGSVEGGEDLKNAYIQPRHEETNDQEFYSFEDLDYLENAPRVRVEFDSGVPLSWAIAWSLKNQLTGIQWFAGIPGTIGGALYNNIHGGTKHFSDNFIQALVWDPNSEASDHIREIGFDDFHFGYDQSLLRQNPDLVVLSVTLGLMKGDVQKARFVASEWAKRKRVQPRNSCGSVFQCLQEHDRIRLDVPTPSVGYLVDKKLGWRGKSYGDVMISPKHGNFIENVGQGKAEDVLRLIREIQATLLEKFQVKVIPEIKMLGFKPEEIAGIYEI